MIQKENRRLVFSLLIIVLFIFSFVPMIFDNGNSQSTNLIEFEQLDDPETQAFYSGWAVSTRTDLNSTFGSGFDNSDDSLINAVAYNSTHVFYTGYRCSNGTTHMWWGFRSHSNYGVATHEDYWSAGVGSVTEGVGLALNADSSRLYIVGHYGGATYGSDRNRTMIGFLVAINLHDRTMLWNISMGDLDIKGAELDGESLNAINVDDDGNLIVVGSKTNAVKNPNGEELIIQKISSENGTVLEQTQVEQEVITGYLVSVKGIKMQIVGSGAEKRILVLAQRTLKTDSPYNTATFFEGLMMIFNSSLALQSTKSVVAGGILVKRINDMVVYQNKSYIISTWANQTQSYGNITVYNGGLNSMLWHATIPDNVNQTFGCIVYDTDGTIYVGGTRTLNNASHAFMAAFDGEDGYLISTSNGSLALNHTITAGYFLSDQFRIFGNYRTTIYVSMVYQCVRQIVQQPTLNELSNYSNNESIVLTWNHISEALGYDIYRSLNNIITLNSAERIGQVGRDVISFVDNDPKAHGTQYYYAIQSWNNHTNASTFSNVVSTTYYAPLDPINLAPPNQSFYLNGSTIRLEWNVVPEAQYFVFESRNINDLENLDLLSPEVWIPDSGQNYTELTKTEVGVYYYRVRAYNETRGNQTSAIVAYSIETKAISPQFILIRSSLADIYDGIAYLSWVHPDESSDYTFHIWRYYTTATGQKREEQKIASVNTTIYVDTDLPSYNFSYYIRAENRTGLAETNSSHVSIAIRRVPQHPTLVLKSDIISRDGRVHFTWNVTPMTETQIVVRRFAGSEATAKIDKVYNDDETFVQGIEFRAELDNIKNEYSESGLRQGYWLYYVVAKNSIGVRDIDSSKTLVIYVDTGGLGNISDSMVNAIIIGGTVLVVAVIGYLIYKRKVDYSW